MTADPLNQPVEAVALDGEVYPCNVLAALDPEQRQAMLRALLPEGSVVVPRAELEQVEAALRENGLDWNEHATILALVRGWKGAEDAS